jgi:hypothetical protein
VGLQKGGFYAPQHFEDTGVRHYGRSFRIRAERPTVADELGIVSANQSDTDFPGSIYVMPELPLDRVAAFVGDTADPVAEWVGGFLREPAQQDVIRKLEESVRRLRVSRLLLVGPALCLAVLLQGVASAAIDTTTTGKVCCPHFAGHLENFGGYTFKGRTKPSLKGQFVYFQYKRASADRWRPLKVGLGGSSGNGFYVLNKDRPRDSINRRHRWSVFLLLLSLRENGRSARSSQGKTAMAGPLSKSVIRYRGPD